MITYARGFVTTSSDEGEEILELTSTEEEKKTALRIEVWDVETHEVFLNVWLDREKIVDAVPFEAAADLAPPRIIPLNVEVPVGQTLLAKLKSETSSEHGIMQGALYYTIE